MNLKYPITCTTRCPYCGALIPSTYRGKNIDLDPHYTRFTQERDKIYWCYKCGFIYDALTEVPLEIKGRFLLTLEFL